MSDLEVRAVRVAADVVGNDPHYCIEDVVSALYRTDMLVDPARLAALEAVAEAVLTSRAEGYPVHPDVRKALAALDAAPTATVETGEEVCRCGHPGWKGYKHRTGAPCIRTRP
jgi:hypothetical protein